MDNAVREVHPRGDNFDELVISSFQYVRVSSLEAYFGVLRTSGVRLCGELCSLVKLQKACKVPSGTEMSLKYISVMDLCGGDASKEEVVAKGAERGLTPLPVSVLPTALIHLKQYWDLRFMPDVMMPCTSGPSTVLQTNYLICARERNNKALSVRFLDPLVDGKWHSNTYVVFCRFPKSADGLLRYG